MRTCILAVMVESILEVLTDQWMSASLTLPFDGSEGTYLDEMIRNKIKCQTVHRTVLNGNKYLIYPMALTPEIIESRIQ